MQNQTLDYNISKNNLEASPVRYAGFLNRVCATLIDLGVILLMVIPFIIVLLFVPAAEFIVMGFIAPGLVASYKPYMEYKYGATVGKKQMGLLVVNTDYKKINFKQALLRSAPLLIQALISVIAYQFAFWGEGLSLLNLAEQMATGLFFISALAVIFNSKKQALHDMIGNTYCIHKV